MSRFVGNLKLRALTSSEMRAAGSRVQMWELLEPLIYEATPAPITVPAGFVSDFASIPRLAKWYIDDDDPVILLPSIVHDFLYSQGGEVAERRLTRQEADEIFREAMIASGARKAQAWVVYQAVRLGGASHWRA